MSHERTDFTLLRAALDLTSSLDLKSGLQNFVDQACALTSSPHATMCVLDTWGATTLRLEPHDSSPAPPVPESLPAVIPVNTPLLVNSPQDAPDIDLPASTPPFLGVSVLVHEQVYGRLYLMGKPGGYTDEDAAVVAALAPAAGIAVENANLYADSKRTARWISASQSLTTTMLEGADEEEALELIAKTVREVSHADTAIIVLQSVGDTWAAEIVDGKNASKKDLFGGGSGAGVNIQPVAFLVVKDGCVRTIQLSDGNNTVDRALTMIPELVEKVSVLIKKDEPAAPKSGQ